MRLAYDDLLDLITLSTREVQRRLKLKESFVREMLDEGKTLYEAGRA